MVLAGVSIKKMLRRPGWTYRLLNRIFPINQPSIASTTIDSETVRPIQIEGKTYILGLEWRLIPPTRALTRTLTLARKEGKSAYAISEMEDLIGVGSLALGIFGSKFSAALHLANKFSQGGLELYGFEINDRQIAVIALNESRPIPGFDFLGDRSTGRKLIEEFLAIQTGQPVRQVGNAGLLEAEESVALEDLFSAPSKSSRIRSLPSRAGTRNLITIGILLLAIFSGILYWLKEEQEKVLAENRVVRESLDHLYRTELIRELNKLPSAGSARFDAWVEVLKKLPTENQGWRLVRVECSGDECKAQWDRIYGSYSDFMEMLPPETRLAEEVQVKNSPLSASIMTWHKTYPTQDPEKRIVVEDLPAMRDGLRQISDHFQDLSLLGKGTAEMDRPGLFGGTTDSSEIKTPVYFGKWLLTQEIWLLPHVAVDAHCVVDKLEIDFFDDKGQPTNLFKLRGTYYVLSANENKS